MRPLKSAAQPLTRQDDVALDYRTLFECAPNAYFVLDTHACIKQLNQVAANLLMDDTDTLLGRNFGTLLASDCLGEWSRRMEQVLQHGMALDCELILQRTNGQAVYVHVLGHLQAKHVYLSVTDITLRQQATQRSAYYDSLTGLPNRRLMKERVTQAVQSNGCHAALLILDIDHFKKHNDVHGYAVGDTLLMQLAKRLPLYVRENEQPYRQGDTVARLGGDEFAILLQGLSTDFFEATIQAGQVAEKLHQRIGQTFMVDGKDLLCSVSIGISLFTQTDNPDDVFKYSEMAMYDAKKQGRNRSSFFDPQMHASAIAHSVLAHDLRYALARQQLRLHYQMQINQAGRVVGAEALVRWYHPLRGVVYPDEFIPHAEESGLIVQIGAWALRQTCLQLKAWSNSELTRHLQLSVNVSLQHFHQPDFVEQIYNLVDEIEINPELLKIELTESSVLSDVEDAVRKMHALKELGIHFSIDDFGTGYSSLSNLQQLPFNQLKIDQSFIRDLANNPNDAAIVQAIVTMGQAFGLDVVAEGVETEEQRELLGQQGCHAFQGYLFNKPVPIAKFEQALRKFN